MYKSPREELSQTPVDKITKNKMPHTTVYGRIWPYFDGRIRRPVLSTVDTVYTATVYSSNIKDPYPREKEAEFATDSNHVGNNQCGPIL